MASIFTSGKDRLSIVIAIDISPSMKFTTSNGETRITLANQAIHDLMCALLKNTKARSIAQIAFIAFSETIELETRFIRLNEFTNKDLKSMHFGNFPYIDVRSDVVEVPAADVPTGKKEIQFYFPSFRAMTKHSTNLSNAVLFSIKKLEAERARITKGALKFYAPFFILITDGDPDRFIRSKADQEAADLVNSYCHSHYGIKKIIIPFIIGIGELNESSKQKLKAYSKGFIDGFFQIQGQHAVEQFYTVFKLIGDSIKNSIDLNDQGTFGKKTAAKMKEVMDQINKRRYGY